MIRSVSWLTSILLVTYPLMGHLPSHEEVTAYRSRLDPKTTSTCLSIPEGALVYCFNPCIEPWLTQPLTLTSLEELNDLLRPHLNIPFTKEGFTQAVAKPAEDPFGNKSYSAVWVRDCCWHYYGLKIHHPVKAAKLIKSLLSFYTSEEQLERFLAIIKNPSLADPSLDPMAHMNVPLIRFSSQTLSHHEFEGHVQEWNHLQFDSHGLFLLALSDALSSGILKRDALKLEHYTLLGLFPAFFSRIHYEKLPDAGPWEERLQYNASSVGLVAAGVKRIMEVIPSHRAIQGVRALKSKGVSKKDIHLIESCLSTKSIESLYQSGLKRVERNLSLCGEAPDVVCDGIDRGADAALLFLCLVEGAPYYDNPEMIKQILNINASLIGPYGLYRYRYDPYQSLNYWIQDDVSSLIFGVMTPLSHSVTGWNKGYMPHQQPRDAQWFFDSCFADLYYHLSLMEEEQEAKSYFVRQGDIHLKRALGQLTGADAIAANGECLDAFQLPESINTVSDSEGNFHALPSPISPLSWAKAAMQMALARAQEAHTQVESSR